MSDNEKKKYEEALFLAELRAQFNKDLLEFLNSLKEDLSSEDYLKIQHRYLNSYKKVNL